MQERRCPVAQPQAVSALLVNVQVEGDVILPQRLGEQQAVLHRHGPVLECLPDETRRRVRGHLKFAGKICLLYTSPSPRDLSTSRMPSSA